MAHEEMTIKGDIGSVVMREWVNHRAAKLSLAGGITAQGIDQIVLALSGPIDLLDAMEAACLLGPINVQIAAIDRAPLSPSAFAAAQFLKEFAHG